MLDLTPLRETTSFQEEFQDYTVEILIKHIRRKFDFSERTMENLDIRLRQLQLKDLENLFEDIVDMNTLKQLNAWIDAHLPETVDA